MSLSKICHRSYLTVATLVAATTVAAAPAVAVVPFGAATATSSAEGPESTVQQLAVTTAPLGTAAGSVDGTPVRPEDGVVLAAPGGAGAGTVITAPIATEHVQTVGLSWPAGVDEDRLAPQVRTLVDGRWTSWGPMPIADVSPDSDSVDARVATPGGATESVWFGDAEAVQVSFEPGVLGMSSELELTLVGSELVEPGTAPDGLSRAAVDPTAELLSSSTPAPRIYSRAEWGAAPQSCTPSTASRLVGAVVHHTAGSNAYRTVGEAMQQLRNDQRYHMVTRGWCDLGYNAVVDKWGNVYEGRAHSLTRPVIGVHAGGFNTGTFGISMLGTYDAAPSAETQRTVGFILGRRLGMYGVDPQGTADVWTSGGDNSRYRDQTVRLPRIYGHRDVAYTACPGAGGYGALPAIRKIAADVAADVRAEDALAVVAAVYRDLLRREPDAVGHYDWATQIVTGTRTSAVGAAIATSPEYVRGQVTAAYWAVLGRAPDPGGLEDWTTWISRGHLRTEDLRGSLIASEEYFLRAGRDPVRFIQNLYRDILGRSPGANEVEHWTTQIERSGRYAASSGVWISLESGYLRVNESYQLLLGRGADPSGATLWAHHWLVHGEASMRAGIIDSEEYLLRARAQAAR